MSVFVLYNPHAGKGGKTIGEKLSAHIPAEEMILTDMTEIEDYNMFFDVLDSCDRVIVCGGDGTLNRFVNDTDGIEFPCDIMYFAAGSGNDFLCDLGKSGDTPPISITEYIKNLPVATVNGKRYRFINGVGLGLDGYCCVEVARAKAAGKRTTYIAVALRAFLKDYAPANAEITVDGVTRRFEKVWLVPTMKGRYFGGGVMAAPMQDRRSDSVTLLLMHNAPRLLALLRFPSFMKGTHPKYKKIITILPGRSMTVKFDRPTDMQIDGEPLENVTEYTISCDA